MSAISSIMDDYSREVNELKALNAELLSACKALVTTNPASIWFGPVVERAREAIAKVERERNE